MYQCFPCGLCLCFFLWSRPCPLMYPKSFIILLFIFRSVTRMTVSPSVLRAVLVSTCCLRIIIHSILFYSIIKCPGWRVSYIIKLSIQFSSVAQLCLTLCKPMDCSTPGFPIHHQLPQLTQIHVQWGSDGIQLSLSSPSPPIFNLSQH